MNYHKHSLYEALLRQVCSTWRIEPTAPGFAKAMAKLVPKIEASLLDGPQIDVPRDRTAQKPQSCAKAAEHGETLRCDTPAECVIRGCAYLTWQAQSEREAVPETLARSLVGAWAIEQDEHLSAAQLNAFVAGVYAALASLPAESPAPEVADALRYRWLRAQKYIDIGMAWFVPMHEEKELTPEAMDAAIDAQIAASPKPPQGKMKEGDA